jgi:hypothetical protein
MSIHSNIFHYYRGQTRKSTDETKQLQIENNVTKAFLNVLQHSSPILTKNFFEWLGFKYEKVENLEYLYQVPNILHMKSDFAFILGIADTNVTRNSEIKQYNIPDGAILSSEISILIETKIGLNSYLNIEQLEGHKSQFQSHQNIKEDPILIVWKEIREFFKTQNNKHGVITDFLLVQFEDFCIINSIGEVKKSKEYFFLKFEKIKAQEIARQIDDYIWNLSILADIIDAETKDGIGYSRKVGIKKPKKFATLTIQRQRCLILHIGEKRQNLGLKIQTEVDEMLGKKYDRKEYEYEKYPHETYIRLEWLEDFEQVKKYVDMAYEFRGK